MPVTRIRFVDAQVDLSTKGGWIRKSSEFQSALASMREKNIAPHECLRIDMPASHAQFDTSANNFAAQLNKFAKSLKLPYTAKARDKHVYVINTADLQ